MALESLWKFLSIPASVPRVLFSAPGKNGSDGSGFRFSGPVLAPRWNFTHKGAGLDFGMLELLCGDSAKRRGVKGARDTE